MRTNIVYAGADELTYEIRGIVTVAKKIEALGQPITWENIGDPVQKGEQVPAWIKDIVKKNVENNAVFGYSPTKGLESTRKFLADFRTKESGIAMDPEDILFFNGLGDAISKVYTYLNENARIIGPSPAYSTHSSAEAGHAGSHHLTYNLLPERNWLPDINDLRNKIQYNPSIAGILIINPDNPTGMVYPRRILEEIVDIAREYDLFIISDEIYAHLVYGETKMTPLAEIIKDVPGIAMRGISKEMPWPGSRCGWIEVYNRARDAQFARYVQTILDAKMLEVCSTTLPQAIIPEVFSDARYKTHLEDRAKLYSRRADVAYKILRDTKGILAPKPCGAFYVTVIFPDGLPARGTLQIENTEIKKYIEEITNPPTGGCPADKRFAYYLLGKTGICTVPLSGFNSNLMGFRVTLLETDEKKFEWIFTTLKTEIENYIKST